MDDRKSDEKTVMCASQVYLEHAVGIMLTIVTIVLTDWPMNLALNRNAGTLIQKTTPVLVNPFSLVILGP